MASFLSAPTAVHEAPWIELFGTQVLEDAAVGTVVGDLFARSDDGSPAKFQLLDDADGRFRLEGTKLVVAESGRIDYETLPWLPVTIRCTDAFGAFRDRTFNLQVRDVWEQGQPDATTPPPPEPVPPQEHRAPDLVRLTGDWVGEITNVGFIVGTIKAYDADGDALTYTLADDADGRFTIINNALVVADGSRFDFETAPTVDVRVRVTDATGLSAEKTFTIQVMDRDEPTPPPPVNHAPQDVELTGRAVIENASTGTVVGALKALDADGDVLTYSLVDNAADRFAIKGDKLVVLNGAKLDFETQSSHTVAVRATDSHGVSVIKTFEIAVLDAPESGSPPPPARDPIVGTEGDDTLMGDDHDNSYLALGGDDVIWGGAGNDTLDGGSGDDVVFGYDGNDTYIWRPGDAYDWFFDTGGTDTVYLGALESDLTFVRSGPVGYDTELRIQQGSSTLVLGGYFNTKPGQNTTFENLVFSDGTVWTREQVLEATNRAPIDVRLSNNHVMENPGPVMVGGFDAVDPDGNPVTYTLIDDADGRFKILDGHMLCVADGSRIDYETAQTHDIKVRVTDSYGASTDRVFTINVIDRDDTTPPPENSPPDKLMLDGVAVVENAATGDKIGRLIGHDPNGDELTFTLTDNAGGRFAIINGFVVVADGTKLDYETATTHQITIRVADPFGASCTATFTIHVRDVLDETPQPPPVNHAPSEIVLHAQQPVPENAPNGLEVGLLTAIDPDGDAVTFTLKDNAGGRFALVGNRIVVADGSKLDYETATSHAIIVIATDAHGLSVARTFDIKLLDLDETPQPPPVNHAPSEIVLHAQQPVPENAPNGLEVGLLTAIDPDGDAVTFTLKDNADGRFALVGNRIVVADGSKLDYETATSHAIIVIATDAHGLSVARTFDIKLLDLDESGHPPTDPHAPSDILFIGSHSLPENTPNGAPVAMLKAVDPDGDAVTLTLVDDAGGRFAIVGEKIVVADGSKLDYETASTHTIAVKATDSSGLSFVKTFTIDLQDMPETGYPVPQNHAPSNILLSDDGVLENSANGTVVSLILGKDEDAGDALTFTLLDDAGGRFAIMGDELQVANGALLDHEGAASHAIRIRVNDSHGASLDKAFVIQVDDDDQETVPGSDANDTIIGGGGNDTLSGHNGNDVITGGAGNDALAGGAGNDRLFGGRGNDTLEGGTGKDVLTGGAGKDTFVFASKLTKANVDRITDFSAKDDTIQLAKSFFGAISKGTLAEKAFVVGTKAEDADDRVIYSAKSGALLYDADGSGTAYKPVLVAAIGSGLKLLSHTDFFVI